MSTAELKEIIDQRTPEERKWMTAYLLDEMFSVPELRQTAEELSRLAQRLGIAGTRDACVTQARDNGRDDG